MTGKILLTMAMSMGITYACVKQTEMDQRVSLLDSKHENYIVELGDELPLDASRFIDETKTSAKMMQAQKRVKYYSTLDGIGTYEGELSISNQSFPISVRVVDRTSPAITLKDSSITFPYGTNLQNYDFIKYIEVTDLSSTTINVTHQIDSTKAGRYEVLFEVHDASGNQTVAKMEVIISEKRQAVSKKQDTKNSSSSNHKNKYDFSDQFEIIDYKDAEHWTINYYGDWHYLGENGGRTFYGSDLLPLPEDVMSGKVAFDK